MDAAAGLLRTAANEGDAEAQNSLGAFYYFGLLGVDRDETEAVRWFRRAAEQGHADAQHRLGSAYRTQSGFGVATPNDTEAVMWFRNAASQGHAQAQYDLARQLWRGGGVIPSHTLARMQAVWLISKQERSSHSCAYFSAPRKWSET